MVKVSVITAFTPTSENKGGISALLYHLIQRRPSDVNLKIYSFNLNKIDVNEKFKISEELHSDIEYMPLPAWYKIISYFRTIKKILFTLLKYPYRSYIKVPTEYVDKIRKNSNDFIWVYPYFHYAIADCFPDTRVVVSGVDCLSLVYSRRWNDNFFLNHLKRKMRIFFEQQQCMSVEKNFQKENIIMHYVGMEDCLFYKRLHHATNAFFLLHPHYELRDKTICFNTPKLRVLIAGNNDLYMQTDANIMIEALINRRDLIQNIKFSFLGKGWHTDIVKLQKVGYDCNEIGWVDDYAEEIIKYDIQISPICVGSGTKGKVLDALANGLLVIGSYNALENICVRNAESCLRYKEADDIPELLKIVGNNRKRYEQVAEKGRQQVRKYHSPERNARRFFEIALTLKS